MSCTKLYLHAKNVYLCAAKVYVDMIRKYLTSENILLNGVKLIVYR